LLTLKTEEGSGETPTIKAVGPNGKRKSGRQKEITVGSTVGGYDEEE